MSIKAALARLRSLIPTKKKQETPIEPPEEAEEQPETETPPTTQPDKWNKKKKYWKK